MHSYLDPHATEDHVHRRFDVAAQEARAGWMTVSERTKNREHILCLDLTDPRTPPRLRVREVTEGAINDASETE